MNKIKRIGMVAVLTLALSLGTAGVAPDADAALTLGALTIESSAALTIDGAAASILTIGDAAQTAAVNIGVSSATLSALNIGTGAGITNINIGTDNTGSVVDVIIIGSANDNVDLAGEDIALTSADDIAINSGSTAGIINIGTSAFAQVLNLGVNALGNTVNIGTNNTITDTIVIGSALDNVDLAGEDIALTSADDIAINSGSTAGIINIGTSAFAQVLNLGVNALGNTVNIGTNNTIADTIAIGSALDAVTIRGATITIGNVADASVSITDDHWSVTVAGVADFTSLTVDAGAELDTKTAGALLLGATTATSVDISATTETTTIKGLLNVDEAATFDTSASATTFMAADAYRVTNGSQVTATIAITKANLQAASHFDVNSSAGTNAAVDVDLGATTESFDAGDVGRHITFGLTTGTGILTVTANDTLTVTTVVGGATANVDAAGDFIDCLVLSTTAVSCVSYAQ